MKHVVINDVKLFPTVYRRIYCRKFLTLSNQMSRYKSKRIRMPYILQKMVTPAITAAASCIIAGSSVAGTTINGIVGGTDYNVVCGIQIENWTNLLLEKPCAVKNGGHIKIPPRQVLPGQKEIMVILAHKIELSVVFIHFISQTRTSPWKR